MNDQIQTEEFNLLDLLKLLVSKIKLLLLVLIGGCLIGGSVGLLTTHDINYYGTSLEFYVNPEKPEDSTEGQITSNSTYGVYGAYGRHVMDNMVKLLSSQSFTEKLILNGSHLPEKDVWVNPSSQAETELRLNEKIDAAQEKIDAYEIEKQALDVAIAARNEKIKALNTANESLNEEWQKLFRDQKVTSSSFSDSEYWSKSLGDSYPDLKNAYQARETAQGDVNTATERVTACQQTAAPAKTAAEAATDLALRAWRKTAKYKANLQKISSAVTFSYVEEEDDLEDAVNLARSFIYVDISVLGDENKAFAEDLLLRIQTEVPLYVCEKMIVPDGYSGTSCAEITTTSEITLTNPRHGINSAIKYALIAGAIALVVACVAVIVIDRSDKRVRDYDAVARTLHIPVLGVVPSIDEEKINAWKENSEGGAK